MPEPLRRVTATRYVTALREGGWLPGLLEADDDGIYVTKFSGAGQGMGALVAEVLAGELGRAIGPPVPELVVVDVPPELGHAEPDPEIQELLAVSPGLNLGMDFLPGSLPFTTPAEPPIDPALAADVVWFDTLVTNVDRTHRNPNLLLWHGQLWLIDHGAAFFRQHGERPLAGTAGEAVPMLAEHVLLGVADPIRDADERLAGPALAAIDGAVALVPDAWLGADPTARRSDLVAFLTARLEALRRVASGDPGGGALAALEPSERFGWLVAPSSTIIQPSEVHTGLTGDPHATLERLFETLVA